MGINATFFTFAFCFMARLAVLIIDPCVRFEGFLPSRRKRDLACTYRIAVVSVTSLHLWYICAQTSPPALMKERLRGRPRRGSPWKPRRPSVSPSASPSTCSSSRPPTPSTVVSPPPSHCMLPHSMATIPRGSAPLLRCPQDPWMQFSAPLSIPGPSRLLSGAPPAYGEPKCACLHLADHLESEHFRDRLVILYDLVFELRTEVADLKYRLQATDDNVVSFLHLISTMHSELASDPVDSAPGKAPDAAMGAGMDGMPRPAEEKQEKVERRGQAVDTTCDERKEKRWDDQSTFIEEEPWTEDLRATWIGYLPGV
jgi:hypothetical protein